MSAPPKPPERLAEILLEILALSDPTRTSEPEFISDNEQKESPDQHHGNDELSRRDEDGNVRERV